MNNQTTKRSEIGWRISSFALAVFFRTFPKGRFGFQPAYPATFADAPIESGRMIVTTTETVKYAG
jgi:hypothetical protein